MNTIIKAVAEAIRERVCFAGDHEGKGIEFNFPLDQERHEICYVSPRELADIAAHVIADHLSKEANNEQP